MEHSDFSDDISDDEANIDFILEYLYFIDIS